MAAKAKTLNHPALALTDKDGGYGLIHFYQACQKSEIKPILGVELALAKHSKYEQRSGIDGSEGTIVLLAGDMEGYKSIMKIISDANLDGMYHQPRTDIESLKAATGLVYCLTGSDTGALYKTYRKEGEAAAKALYTSLQEALGEKQILLEVVARNTDSCRELNNFVMTLSNGDDMVVTCDARYAEKDQEEAAEALHCVAENALLTDQMRSKKATDNHLKNWSEITRTLSYIDQEKLEQMRKKTLSVAENCNVTIDFGQMYFPLVKLPEGKTEGQVLREMCAAQVDFRYGHTKREMSEVQERMNYELDMIEDMGFSAYFIIVEDFIRYAKEKGIAVGPGRGSAAGSIVSYLLGITNIDPLKYDLLFERFLNPHRVTMPDIDIDFSDERRHEVMQDYLIEKYGQARVSQVCTFGRLSAKAALKDMGRVLGLGFQRMNDLSKIIPSTPGIKLKDVEQIKEVMDIIDESDELTRALELAKQVEGSVRQLGVHACAVIITPDPMVNYCPIQRSPSDDNVLITQYDYYKLEDMGLLKMDFLGLKNLSVIEKCLLYIQKSTGDEVDMNTISMKDPAVFEMLSKGDTTGVFQFESAGMRRYLKELKPTEFEDMVAMAALYRPGPMEFIPQYIEGKYAPESVKYPHKVFEKVLGKTYGIAVYQEQILQIAQQYAGFSLGEADILRRAIGKKKLKMLAEQRQKFIDGAIALGEKEQTAASLFDDKIVPFARYGFNRSHAVSYARIAYETAYLKAHYPVEFMAAMLTTDRDNNDRVVFEMNECQKYGITVLPPSANQSGSHFTVVDTEDKENFNGKAIRFGLTAIKGLGEDSASAIIAERDAGGTFASLGDFARRLPIKLMNKKSLEALSFSGALDDFGNRGSIVYAIPDLIKYAKEQHEKSAAGQGGLFDMMEDTSIDEFTLVERAAAEADVLQWEREALGMFVSSHPLSSVAAYINKKGTAINQLEKPEEGKRGAEVVVHGLLNSVRRLTTKKGDAMAILVVEDMTASVEVAVFPKTYETVEIQKLQEDAFVRVKGRVNNRQDRVNIIADEIKFADLTELKKRQKFIENGGAFADKDENNVVDDNENDIKNEMNIVSNNKENKAEKLHIQIPNNADTEKVKALAMKIKQYAAEDKNGTTVTLQQGQKVMPLPYKISVNDTQKVEIQQWFDA